MRRIITPIMISFFILFKSPMSLAETTLQINTLLQNEGDTSEITEWLSSQQCFLKITAGNRTGVTPDFVYDLFVSPPNEPQHKPLLMGKNRGQHPLQAAWLVHKSTGLSSLTSLKNERAAVQAPNSLIGYTDPLQQMLQANIKPDDLKLYPTASYEGAIALLLHGDVTAAAIPLPLAIPWAKANNLTILSTGKKRYSSAIWSDSKATLTPECREALLTIKKENRRDKKMAVFPEWLEGFRLP